MNKQLQQAVDCLHVGGIISYPTEAVFGLGVDPDNYQAIAKLLAIKSRPKEKGLILVASHWQLLSDYVDFDALNEIQLQKVLVSWPGPTTWIIPLKKPRPWLSGSFNSLAVRVSDHELVQSLCRLYGKPLVSTSANRSGQEPAINKDEVEVIFSDGISYVVDGQVGPLTQPTQIFDALSGKRLR